MSNEATIDAIGALIAAQYPEGQEGMHARLEALGIDWHCPNRHGVVRNVSPHDLNDTLRTLTYFFGDKCAWKKGRDLEFVHMCKVFPPPRRPWEWCGTSVLFKDWHTRENLARAKMADFRLGQVVEFTDRHGVIIRATVSNFGSKRVTTVTPDGLKYHVPATMLRPATKATLPTENALIEAGLRL